MRNVVRRNGDRYTHIIKEYALFNANSISLISIFDVYISRYNIFAIEQFGKTKKPLKALSFSVQLCVHQLESFKTLLYKSKLSQEKVFHFDWENESVFSSIIRRDVRCGGTSLEIHRGNEVFLCDGKKEHNKNINTERATLNQTT